MFSTIHQSKMLSIHPKSMDGIHQLVGSLNALVKEFQGRGHNLLDFLHHRFDRDCVECNVRISDLEGALQDFIDWCFASIIFIETSPKLLGKFQRSLQHGLELNVIQKNYAKLKHQPPLARNMPPVAGSIGWARHLLKRITEPM